jgi:pimeloyl-ACP methyl ester carboxylesterase
LEIIQNAGHIVPFEVPEHFNNVVEAFIEAKV